MRYKVLQIWLLLLLYVLLGKSTMGYGQNGLYQVDHITVSWLDTARNRQVPVAFYVPRDSSLHPKVVIFSHGYGGNKGGDNIAYSYLTDYLASQGYFVASIQHELIEDAPLPMTGELKVSRRPNWERGVQNILFVMKEMKKVFPTLNFEQLALIGHSNGGDMSMLFAGEYPQHVYKVISLDNRRMPWPRTAKPKIYFLRSSDQGSDMHVIPSKEEIKRYGMTIIHLTNVKHNEMDDSGTKEQHDEINQYIISFLE